MDPLITPQQLLPHLNDSDWAIVDCTFDLTKPGSGESQYLQAHILGAVYADLARDLSGLPDGKNGRHPLPTKQALEDFLTRLGIDEHTTVVAYDRNGSPYASRLWWTLAYLGCTCFVLDGGFEAWVEAGYDIRAGAESREPRRFVGRLDPNRLVTAQQVAADLGRGKDLLLDARAPERYRGEKEPYDPVAGHIPGAANFYWKQNLDETGRFLSPTVLKELYTRILGDRPASKVVTYCGSGVTGCHLLLGMAHAGMPGARLFAGSWSEWSSDPARPVAVGDETVD